MHYSQAWIHDFYFKRSGFHTVVQWVKGKSPSHCPAIKVFGNSWIQEMLCRYRMNIFLRKHHIIIYLSCITPRMDVEFYYFWAITNLNLETYLNYRFFTFLIRLQWCAKSRMLEMYPERLSRGALDQSESRKGPVCSWSTLLGTTKIGILHIYSVENMKTIILKTYLKSWLISWKNSY